MNSKKQPKHPILPISPEVRFYFRDQLRQAIASAQQDAEGFHEILFVVERMGITFSGEMLDLGRYKDFLEELVNRESQREAVAKMLPQWHLSFSELYMLVKDARNDAFHTGTAARHITNNAIRLAIVLEDALMSDAKYVREFMVRDPITAYTWQPISLIRQQMLLKSFTFLPILQDIVEPRKWKLIADYDIAKYLHSAPSPGERKKLLAKTVKDAYQDGLLPLVDANSCHPNQMVREIIKQYETIPFLVVDQNNPKALIGLLTAFDLL